MRTSVEAACYACACVLVSLLTMGIVPCFAQQARLDVHADSVSVGDRFRVTISVERPRDAAALFPSPERGDSVLGDLEILSTESFRAEAQPSEGFARDSLRYLVTTFALDRAEVPSQEILLVRAGDTTSVMTPSLSIPVRSLVPEDAADVRDLTPIVPFRPALWPWIVAALALAAGIAALLYYRRRKRLRADRPLFAPAVPELSPYEEALERLQRLEEFDLEGAGAAKPFYVELTDILRTYLERRTGIPALESTTRDLVRTLERKQMQGFPSTAVALVKRVLDTADLAKFADIRPPTARGYETVGETRQIVEDVERSMRPEPIEASRDT